MTTTFDFNHCNGFVLGTANASWVPQHFCFSFSFKRRDSSKTIVVRVGVGAALGKVCNSAGRDTLIAPRARARPSARAQELQGFPACERRVGEAGAGIGVERSGRRSRRRDREQWRGCPVHHSAFGASPSAALCGGLKPAKRSKRLRSSQSPLLPTALEFWIFGGGLAGPRCLGNH